MVGFTGVSSCPGNLARGVTRRDAFFTCHLTRHFTRHLGPHLARMKRLAAPLTFGRYPTPVERVDVPAVRDAELWVKRDDRSHDVYGGNKVRKLEWLLADARARRATRILTVGAGGSHHVLATTYFGVREGFEVEAVLVPQPRTQHAVDVLRAGLALGLRPSPVSSWAAAAAALSRRLAWSVASSMVSTGGATRFVPIGGSSVIGAMGYAAAARELAAQVRAGEMPEPDVCVVAMGSGGTAAGLTAGFAAERLKTRVVGVCVSRPPWALRAITRGLARACAERLSLESRESASPEARERPMQGASLRARLVTDMRFLGRGYGHSTPEGDEATRAARDAGLALDPTYTAKAFAAALWRVRRANDGLGADDQGGAERNRRERIVLYWHTLSSAPMKPLLEKAPAEAEFDARLRRLFV